MLWKTGSVQTPLQQQFRVCLPHQPCRDRTQNNSHHSCTYCILNRAFCLDDFTSSLIALTTLSRSSFKLCLTRANICSIVSFIESALANIISLLNVYLLFYFYFFINFSIRTALLRVKLLKVFILVVNLYWDLELYAILRFLVQKNQIEMKLHI